ncbi:PREDICTED: F-box/LRR-repeat protein At4g14096-like [Fragaria vesca subsp. vesca]|uniref:probable FBD-associated F-box protein At1g32375 isoform X3 n=1 Tax=Fragaria vesca subsp. vesca TaxID=101020 RepID=UPI0002C35E36|nr:PREDICTED: probable FBD-associated F-box protein At1g32375 isoform X3 [Fragaria vesca subsp. vesca]
MASSLVHHKRRIEDRISGLPEAVLCHILSFLTTLEAVQTSVLSHSWKNVWASVPVLDLDEMKFYKHCVNSRKRYERSYFEEFVDDLLFNRGEANIYSFRLNVISGGMNSSHIDAWISTAIRHNVVELNLRVGKPTRPHFEIPMLLFTCSTLMRLKLLLCENFSATIPSSNCFPSLKFLHVTVQHPDSDLMEKFFSCFPALEELIIDGDVAGATAYNLVISAPKLIRLHIWFIVPVAWNYECQIFVTADTPNLEEVDIEYDCLVSYSLKNANCLRKAKIFFHTENLEDRDYFLGLPDRICQLFADICHARSLTVSSTIFSAVDIRYHSLLLTFGNLNHLELQLQTCRYLQSLTTLLKISPNLEHLKISAFTEIFYGNKSYCDDVELEHGWDAPESVPVCLISHLKTICLWDFQGCPDDMEVAMYLVKHGKALNKVTIYNHFSNEEMELRSTIALWSKFSNFPRGSETCKIQFETMV